MKSITKLFSGLTKKSYGATLALADLFSSNARFTPTTDNTNWVWILTDKIADAVSDINLRLYKQISEDEVEEVLDHELLDLLARPNEDMTGYELIYRTVGQLKQTGATYYYMEDSKTEAGKTDIFIIPESQLSTKMDTDGLRVATYEYNNPISGQIRTIPKDKIVSVRKPDFYSNKGGAGIGEKIETWIDTDAKTALLNQKVASTGTFMGTWVETNATTNEEIDRTAKRFDKKYGGEDISKKLKTIVTGEGTKIHTQPGSARDMELSVMDERVTMKILNAFGVPKSILAEVDGKGRANIEGAIYAFMKFTVVPTARLIVHALNETLIPRLYPDEAIFFDFDDPTPEDKEHNLNFMKAAGGGAAWLTQNELRAMGGPGVASFEDIEGGDEVPSQGVTVNVGGNSDEEKSVKVKAAASTHAMRVLAKRRRALVEKKDRQDVAEKAATDIISKITEKTAKAAVEKKKLNKSALADVEEGIKQALEAHLHKKFVGRMAPRHAATLGVTVKYTEELKERVKENLPAYIKAQKNILTKSTEILDAADETRTLGLAILPILREILEDEGIKIMDILGAPESRYNVDDKKLNAAVQAALDRRGESYTKTNIKKLNAAIKEGLAAGESLAQITKRTNTVLDIASKTRAKSVASDVVFATANSVTKSAYIQSEVVSTMRWYTAEDERVCPFCNAMHGTVVSIDDKFFEKGETLVVNGQTLDMNFEDVEHPPIHSRCRCFILPDQLIF